MYNDNTKFPSSTTDCRYRDVDGLQVDPAGELLALTTHGEVCNAIIGALELKGDLDIGAMETAVSEIVRVRPRLAMPLRELRKGLKHYLCWDETRICRIPVTTWDLPQGHAGRDTRFDTLLHWLRPIMREDRNIFRQPPFEVHVLRKQPDLNTLATVVSHVGADAITLLALMKELALKYHQLVTGEDLGIRELDRAASTAFKRSRRRNSSGWKDYLTTCKHAFVPFSGTSVPRGSGSMTYGGEHHIKSILTRDETLQVFRRASKLRIFVVDYLLACGLVAVRQWNRTVGVESSKITAALTVNLNGRTKSNPIGNNDSVLYFQWYPEELKNIGGLGKTILRSRLKQFRDQLDIKYVRGMEKMNNALRVFPYTLRSRLYRGFLQKHQTSFALGYLGVLWPMPEGDLPLRESYLRSVGALEIEEVHGFAYRIFSRTPAYLSAYIFREQLNIVLSAAGWLFTPSESGDFMGLFMNIVSKGDKGF